jgi:TIR domain-containing protein
MAKDLHSALRSEEIDSISQGLPLKVVRLQHGKDQFSYSLHAFPNSFSSAGLQTTDLLAFLGFRRGPCGFGASECYAVRVGEGFKLAEFSAAFRKFSELVNKAERHLSACGLYLPQPEGWSYFVGGGRPDRRPAPPRARGNGHHSPKQERMKESEDESFRYVFTWIEGGSDKGWVTHYVAKDDASAERLAFLPNLFSEFQRFEECPEFGFEPCFWRFTTFESRDDGWRSNVDYAHGFFDDHAANFAPGVAALFEADALMHPLDFTYLPRPQRPEMAPVQPRQRDKDDQRIKEETARRDAFICHAGEDKQRVVRPLVETLTKGGITAWFDEAEVRWGDSLTAKVNEGLRISRFVVVVLSPAFIGKDWPERELNAALNIETSTGQVKVLPMLVGTASERATILGRYPLLNDKAYLVWDGTGASALDAIRGRLS